MLRERGTQFKRSSKSPFFTASPDNVVPVRAALVATGQSYRQIDISKNTVLDIVKTCPVIQSPRLKA
jgi:hypothetical protein